MGGLLAKLPDGAEEQMLRHLIAAVPHPCSPSVVVLSSARRSESVLLPLDGGWRLDSSKTSPTTVSVDTDADPGVLRIALRDESVAGQREALYLRDQYGRPAILPIVVLPDTP